MPPFTPPEPLTWRQMIDPRQSLTARAALAAGGAALGLVLLVMWTSAVIVRRQLERQLGSAFESLADQIGDKLERNVYERYRQLQFTAGLPAFRNAAAPADDRRALLAALHDSTPDFAWVGFANAEGLITAGSQHLFENETVETANWFRSARRRPFVGSLKEIPVLAAASGASGTGEPPRFLDLAVPVNTAAGQFLGVLGAQVRWSWAREVQLSVVPETAKREQLGVTIYGLTGEVLLDSSGSGWTEPPSAPPDLPERPGIHGAFVEKLTDGAVYFTAYVRCRGFREYRGIGWLVVVRQPAERALAPVGELRARIFWLGLIFVFAMAVAAGIVAARLERRFRAIALAARRIGDGDIDTLMPQPGSGTELGRMCDSLADMVGKLRERGEPAGRDSSK